MYGEMMLFIAVLIIGIAAFVFGIAYFVFRGAWRVLGGVAGLFRGPRVTPPPLRGAGHRPCPREGCGKVDRRAAVYCSQCGARLDESPRMRQRDKETNS